MRDPGVPSFEVVVDRHLGPLLAPLGFERSAGLPANPKAPVSVTYCVGFDEIAARHLDVPVPDGYCTGSGYCYDVVVTGSLVAGIDSVRMEGVDLEVLKPGAVSRSGDLSRDLRAARDALAALLS